MLSPVIYEAVHAYLKGRPPMRAAKIGRALEMPHEMLYEALAHLEAHGSARVLVDSRAPQVVAHWEAR